MDLRIFFIAPFLDEEDESPPLIESVDASKRSESAVVMSEFLRDDEGEDSPQR